MKVFLFEVLKEREYIYIGFDGKLIQIDNIKYKGLIYGEWGEEQLLDFIKKDNGELFVYGFCGLVIPLVFSKSNK